ncbi:MAG: zinc ribbon domain-containing protein [Rhodocyclaceae bacterium]|nr:zinc ribbon domain-containing protein [Rhodocyclaceae bacterium]MBX3670334.1 zinc ribbon domain-containing protein [Rhodocyclaceae bacterium]
MPIYEYRCSDCGHQKDVLQKVSAAPLTTCPACGKETFAKLISAAGFQLKGSGWYATDFKSTGSGTASAKAADSKESKDSKDGGSTDKPAAATPCGGSCACH